jgi:hypothetical protein
MTRWRTFAAVAATIAALAQPAGAQVPSFINPYTGGWFNNPTSSYLATVMMNRMRMQALLRDQARRHPPPADRPTRPKPGAPGLDAPSG